MRTCSSWKLQKRRKEKVGRVLSLGRPEHVTNEEEPPWRSVTVISSTMEV